MSYPMDNFYFPGNDICGISLQKITLVYPWYIPSLLEISVVYPMQAGYVPHLTLVYPMFYSVFGSKSAKCATQWRPPAEFSTQLQSVYQEQSYYYFLAT